MTRRFEGRKLLVVGGTSGMGLQTARGVLTEGGSVVVVGRMPTSTCWSTPPASSRPSRSSSTARPTTIAT